MENRADFIMHAESNYLRRPIQAATIDNNNNVAHKTVTCPTNYLLFQNTHQTTTTTTTTTTTLLLNVAHQTITPSLTTRSINSQIWQFICIKYIILTNGINSGYVP